VLSRDNNIVAMAVMIGGCDFGICGRGKLLRTIEAYDKSVFGI
jgi:hypothetical protein